MIFIEHAPYNQSTIRDNFGAPDYSYLFIRNAFRDVLDQLGRRVDVADPREVDDLYAAAQQRGEPCVYLSYHPPQRTTLNLACPTIPVFAWEYNTIPSAVWDDNPRNDWRTVFARTGMAITLSRSAAQAVRDGMGENFPVWPIPAPLFDMYAGKASSARGWREPFSLVIEGRALAINAGAIDLGQFHPDRPSAEAAHALRVLDRAASRPGRAPRTIALEGVIYTAVLCPADGRKNWRDLLGAFIYAFRNAPSATLLFKLTHANVEDGLLPVLSYISTLGPFECQVVLINGMLSDDAYAGLIDATSYAVNTALAEGQCLPLTEYMSAGRPSVAPSHSAMLDYVLPSNSFVVLCEERLAAWPQDERRVKTARHHRTSFLDLVKQYRASYAVARHEPERYAQMSANAVQTMHDYCSSEVVAARLREVMRHVQARPALGGAS